MDYEMMWKEMKEWLLYGMNEFSKGAAKETSDKEAVRLHTRFMEFRNVRRKMEELEQISK